MPGSAMVNANITLWEKTCISMAGKAMDTHIKSSAMYARNVHPWKTRTGRTRDSVISKTFMEKSSIVSSVAYSNWYHGYFLENPNDTVTVYGRGITNFGSKYENLENARNFGLSILRMALRFIFLVGGARGIPSVSTPGRGFINPGG